MLSSEQFVEVPMNICSRYLPRNEGGYLEHTTKWLGQFTFCRTHEIGRHFEVCGEVQGDGTQNVSRVRHIGELRILEEGHRARHKIDPFVLSGKPICGYADLGNFQATGRRSLTAALAGKLRNIPLIILLL